MLLLAQALILTDYFMSPVVINKTLEKSWKFEQIVNLDHTSTNYNINNNVNCSKLIKEYNRQHKNLLAQACLTNHALVIIEQSHYKGVLSIYQSGKIQQIALNLQQPSFQLMGVDNEIYILEKGRNRLLKFWKTN